MSRQAMVSLLEQVDICRWRNFASLFLLDRHLIKNMLKGDESFILSSLRTYLLGTIQANYAQVLRLKDSKIFDDYVAIADLSTALLKKEYELRLHLEKMAYKYTSLAEYRNLFESRSLFEQAFSTDSPYLSKLEEMIRKFYKNSDAEFSDEDVTLLKDIVLKNDNDTFWTVENIFSNMEETAYKKEIEEIYKMYVERLLIRRYDFNYLSSESENFCFMDNLPFQVEVKDNESHVEATITVMTEINLIFGDFIEYYNEKYKHEKSSDKNSLIKWVESDIRVEIVESCEDYDTFDEISTMDLYDLIDQMYFVYPSCTVSIYIAVEGEFLKKMPEKDLLNILAIDWKKAEGEEMAIGQIDVDINDYCGEDLLETFKALISFGNGIYNVLEEWRSKNVSKNC